MAEENDRRLRIRLRDPSARLPDLVLRHRNERRLFIKANYLVIESDIPGTGAAEDGELVFRFRGPLARQRGSVRWRAPVPGGEEWLRDREGSLLRGAGAVEAIQSLQIAWEAEARTWHLRLETMSGSVVSGLLAPLPVAVPFDRREAEGVLTLLGGLAES